MDSHWRRLARSPAFAPTLACAAISIALTLWPADVPWGADEATLIAHARAANAAGRLAEAGLHGTVGLQYGPLPTIFYQALLRITDDLPIIVRLRAALFASSTAAALLWLARTLGWSPWLAVLPMLSPFFWLYARMTWDNTFAIPLGALLLASWAAYLRHARPAAFATAAAAAVALLLVHPMTLPLVAAVAAHALLMRGHAFAVHWKALAVIAVVTLVTHARYLLGFDWPRLVSFASPPTIVPSWTSSTRVAGFPFPLFAGRLLSAFRFVDARGPELGLETTVVGLTARRASAIAYGLVWIGMIAFVVRLARRRAPDRPIADTIGGICLGAFALQSFAHATTRLDDLPHYYNGTWAAAVVFLWAGLRVLSRIRLGVAVGIVLGVSLTICTVAFALDIHRGGGGRIWHGPTYDAHRRSGAPDPR